MTSPIIQMPDGRAVVVESPRARGNGKIAQGAFPSVSSRAVQFARLQSGDLVDLVLGPSGSLSLLIYRNGKATVRDYLSDGGVTLVPPKVDRSLAEAVRWPTFADTNDTPHQLLDDMKSRLRQYVDLDDRDYDLVAHFCLHSWFGDVGSVAPYLWVIGPYSGGKTTLLRLMSAFCRRAVRAADITSAALYSLCEALRPTLLLDELELDSTARGRDLARLLRSGSTQGQKVLRHGRAYDLFGPKVIVSRQEPPDAALASRALFVAIRPCNRDLPPLDEASLSKLADQFQPRLFAFRLRNYSQTRSSELAANGLSPRMKDIARALAIPLLADAELESGVIEMLQPQDAQAKVTRGGEPEWVVATALYKLCHRAANYWTVKEITDEVDYVLEGYGETYELVPRKVGDILRSLGFRTEKLGNQGRGLRVTQVLCRSIHETAKALGLCRADMLDPQAVMGGRGGSQCDLCEERGLVVDDRGNRLRTIPLSPPIRSGLFGKNR
jgi:hypothetical protein